MNNNMKSDVFQLHDNDTLIIGRNAFYLSNDPNNPFKEIYYKVNLVNNSLGNVQSILAEDTIKAGDSVHVEYLEGFIINNIPNGVDSFYVQMVVDTSFGGGDGFGLDCIAGGFSGINGGGDNNSLMSKVFFKNAKPVHNSIPIAFNLYQNYPNPFNPVTKIKYDLPKNTNVTIKVYDLLGREVTTLINNEFRNAGRYEVNWNASNYASGVYFYRIQAADYTSVKKMVLIK
jgi:hypothetical protein